MQKVADEGSGVIIILREPQNNTQDMLDRLKAFESQPIVQDNTRSSPADLKTYGIGAQILADLGVQKMRVMSAPKRFLGIAGFGLEVVDYIHN
jgi:3,4-dihydroxy 2-butanone 4-phosphate synthase/GTP cyclohydrolase II